MLRGRPRPQDAGDLQDRSHARAVIGRPWGYGPRIVVRAQQHRVVIPLAARNSHYHVGRNAADTARVTDQAGLQFGREAEILQVLDDALAHHCVGGGAERVRNPVIDQFPQHRLGAGRRELLRRSVERFRPRRRCRQCAQPDQREDAERRDGDPARDQPLRISFRFQDCSAVLSPYCPLPAARPAQRRIQNSPEILPSASISIELAAGTLGNPGMVMISPQIITTTCAPAASRTSRILTTWPEGAPRSFGSVENEYWVLATHTG